MPGASSFLESGWTSSDDELAGYESGDNNMNSPTIAMNRGSSKLCQELDLARPRATSVDVSELQRATLPSFAEPSAPASPPFVSSRLSVMSSPSVELDQHHPSSSRSRSMFTVQEDGESATSPVSMQGTSRDWRKSMQDKLAKLDTTTPVANTLGQVARVAAFTPDPERPLLQSKRVTVQHKSGISMLTVLERLMKQHDMAGNGLSQVVATDIAILLWMMMEVGNAWTAMALSLIAADAEVLSIVQNEIDYIEQTYGKDDVFSPGALSRMKYLDALLYEAIRLCPPNLGGMKKTTETIELKDAGVQIPKDSNIFFCRPTDMNFDIHKALGKRPENLGRLYPCLEL